MCEHYNMCPALVTLIHWLYSIDYRQSNIMYWFRASCLLFKIVFMFLSPSDCMSALCSRMLL